MNYIARLPVALFFVIPSLATNYYVLPTGSDSNTGTSASPFKTIQHAADIVNPGDTVIVGNGTYTTTATGAGSILVAPTRSGTSSAWITFMAQNKWGAVLDGQSNATSEGFEIAASYIRVQGFEIKGFDTQGISTYRQIASGGSHVSLVQNHIHDIGRECTSRTDGLNAYFLGGSYNTVDQSLVHDIGRYQVGQNGCTVSDGTDAHDHGVYIGGYSGTQTQITVQNSIFYNTKSGWGVQLYGGSTSNVNIVNNTFAFPNSIQTGHIVLAENVTNAVIENNISYQPNTGFIKIFSGSTFSNIAVNNNLVYQGTLGDSQSGMTFSGNQINTNPLIVSASTFDFHLQINSPAIDSGLTISSVINDFAGTTRPQGSAYDIGAYEFIPISHPIISSFTASPSSIITGSSSTLSWSVNGAASLSIDQGVGTVTGTSVKVKPVGTTIYTLTAIKNGNTYKSQVTVTVSNSVPQRTVGLEPGRQFSGNLPAGVSDCAYGSYLRGMTSGFGGNCPNFIKEGDHWPHAYWATAAQSAYMPISAMAYNVTVNSGLVGQISFGCPSFCQNENILNVGDSSYLSWLHNTYNPLLMRSGNVPSTLTKWGWYLWTMDGYTSNYSAIGATINGTFTNNGITIDPAFPQTTAAWNAGWNNYFTYAKTINSPVRYAPHIGSMTDWSAFQTIFANCPAMLREWFNLSDTHSYNSQFYNQELALYWLANVAPKVFPNDPPTRIIDFGVNIDNGDIHSALAIYAMVRGPNTFFSALGPTPQTAYNPSAWLPTATKLGPGTSAPAPFIGSGPSSVLRRTFQGGIAYFNVGAGTQTINLPSGSFDWSGNPITSITLSKGKGDVVLNSNQVVSNLPTISVFSASPATITSGGSSTLSWSVSNATSLSIDQGVGPVTGSSVSVSPTGTTTYTLTASNANGSVSAATVVTVSGGGGGGGGGGGALRGSNIGCSAGTTTQTVSLPSSSAAGDIAVIFASGGTPAVPSGWAQDFLSGGTEWDGMIAHRVLTSGDISAGSVTVSYFGTLGGDVFDKVVALQVFVGAGGGMRETENGTNAGPQFTVTLTASSATQSTDTGVYFASGRSAATMPTITPASGTATTQQTCITTNAKSILATQPMPGGSLNVVYFYPSGASNGSRQLQAIVEVSAVSGPPTINSFTASPSTVTQGASSTLSWNVSGASSLFIDNGVGTVSGTSTTVNPFTTTTYTLTATNNFGSVTQTATVTVSAAGGLPTISSFTATPGTIASGGLSTLAWTTTGATSLSIDQGVGTVTGLTSTPVSPTATTTYTLTATNSVGSVTQSVVVTVTAPPLPTIVSFIATPSVISLGNSSTLSWIVNGATNLSIDNGIGVVNGTTSYVVSPTTTTTYTLTASNAVGNVTATATVTIGASSSTGFTIAGATINGATIPAQ